MRIATCIPLLWGFAAAAASIDSDDSPEERELRKYECNSKERDCFNRCVDRKADRMLLFEEVMKTGTGNEDHAFAEKRFRALQATEGKSSSEDEPPYEEEEDTYEEVEILVEGICNKDLRNMDDVSDLEEAILSYFIEQAGEDCEDTKINYTDFTLFDFDESDECAKKKGNRRELAKKKKQSKIKGQNKGKCNGCNPRRRGLRELGGDTCEADLAESFQEKGFKRAKNAEVTKQKRQDCRRGSSDCKKGTSCCGSPGCRCPKPFKPKSKKSKKSKKTKKSKKKCDRDCRKKCFQKCCKSKSKTKSSKTDKCDRDCLRKCKDWNKRNNCKPCNHRVLRDLKGGNPEPDPRPCCKNCRKKCCKK